MDLWKRHFHEGAMLMPSVPVCIKEFTQGKLENAAEIGVNLRVNLRA